MVTRLSGDRGGASVAYAAAGVVVILFGIWIGFIGYPETTVEFFASGPEGPGIYEVQYLVTYPLLGIFLILGGIGSIVTGVRSAASSKRKEELLDKYATPEFEE